MPRQVIGESGRKRIKQMAARRWGVTVPEVAETLEVLYCTAHRCVQKMVAQGTIKRTDEFRRRTEVFIRTAGRGGRVYRARRRSSVEGDEWVSSRSWRRPKRSRARSR